LEFVHRTDVLGTGGPSFVVGLGDSTTKEDRAGWTAPPHVSGEPLHSGSPMTMEFAHKMRAIGIGETTFHASLKEETRGH